MPDEFKRGEIHIFTEDPYKYISILPQNTQIRLLITYDEVMSAIEDDQKIIYTTQLYFLSHMWIKAGYDLILYDKGCTIKFDDTYLDIAELRYNPAPYFYMISLYTWGELYQIPE